MSTGSFAAAQQRILARHEARRLEAQNARHAEIARVQSSQIGRLPPPLNRAAGSLAHFYSVIAANTGTSPAVRVSQVDAELLDDELLTLLRTQITDALKYFSPTIQDDYSREILLSLRAILFKLSVWDNDASYGASLQGLRYTDARKANDIVRPTRTQKSLYGLITVLGRYAWDKWEDRLLAVEASFEGPSDTFQALRTLTSRLSTVHSVAAFASFCIFLINGRYRTLTDRLLRLRLIPPTSQSRREVSFEYLNRQLVWHAFTEFLLFLLPLVGISRWRRWLSRVWRTTKKALSTDLSSTVPDEHPLKTGPFAFLPERTCAICYQDSTPEGQQSAEVLSANIAVAGGVIGSIATDIVNPYETIPCACLYCFSCIATKIEAEDGAGWPCLRCGELVLKCRPWRGDVLVSSSSSAKSKKVGFVEDISGSKEDDNASSGGGHEAAQIERRDGYETEESRLGSSKWQLEGEVQ